MTEKMIDCFIEHMNAKVTMIYMTWNLIYTTNNMETLKLVTISLHVISNALELGLGRAV